MRVASSVLATTVVIQKSFTGTEESMNNNFHCSPVKTSGLKFKLLKHLIYCHDQASFLRSLFQTVVSIMLAVQKGETDYSSVQSHSHKFDDRIFCSTELLRKVSIRRNVDCCKRKAADHKFCLPIAMEFGIIEIGVVLERSSKLVAVSIHTKEQHY